MRESGSYQKAPSGGSGRAYEALVVDNEVMNAVSAHHRDCVCDVLIQGALEQEVVPLHNALGAPLMEATGPWTFWSGSIGRLKVVLSRTDEGPLNAAAATALGIHQFNPRAIVNHGIAGAHNSELHKGDIVVGKCAVDYSGFRSVSAGRGEGIHCWRWSPKPHKIRTSQDVITSFYSFPAHPLLLELAMRVRYEQGRVLTGTIGSALQYNREVDRVVWLRETYGTDSEDQESAYAAGVAVAMRIPFLSVRVISDSVFTDPVLDKSLGRLSAEFVLALIELIATEWQRDRGIVDAKT